MASTAVVPFLDLIRKTVNEKRDDVFATWYGSNGEPTNEYTFGKLWEEAGVIAHHLRNEWGLEKGDQAVLCYSFGLHFFAAFLGCLRAGVVAVLVYPPGPPLLESLPKLNYILRDCDAKIILVDNDVNLARKIDLANLTSKSRKLWPEKSKFRNTTTIVTTSFWGKKKSPPKYDEGSILLEDLACVQYTSGSTSDPKGKCNIAC